jgi:hypothetical protein
LNSKRSENYEQRSKSQRPGTEGHLVLGRARSQPNVQILSLDPGPGSRQFISKRAEREVRGKLSSLRFLACPKRAHQKKHPPQKKIWREPAKKSKIYMPGKNVRKSAENLS